MYIFFFAIRRSLIFIFFFFNDTATTEIYTLSLHDALPICVDGLLQRIQLDRLVSLLGCQGPNFHLYPAGQLGEDRKSTRLNSSHLVISYAVFCLKKKKKTAMISCT